jgi:hypothetical protein
MRFRFAIDIIEKPLFSGDVRLKEHPSGRRENTGPPKSVRACCAAICLAGFMTVALPGITILFCLSSGDPIKWSDSIMLMLIFLGGSGAWLMLAAAFLWVGSRTGLRMLRIIRIIGYVKPVIRHFIDERMNNPEVQSYILLKSGPGKARPAPKPLSPNSPEW